MIKEEKTGKRKKRCKTRKGQTRLVDQPPWQNCRMVGTFKFCSFVFFLKCGMAQHSASALWGQPCSDESRNFSFGQPTPMFTDYVYALL